MLQLVFIIPGVARSSLALALIVWLSAVVPALCGPAPAATPSAATTTLAQDVGDGGANRTEHDACGCACHLACTPAAANAPGAGEDGCRKWTRPPRPPRAPLLETAPRPPNLSLA